MCDIETVDLHKHLGVIYDTKMSFNIHCNDIFKKAYRKFCFKKYLQNCKWHDILKNSQDIHTSHYRVL